MSFCSLVKGITPEIRMLRFGLINKRSFELFFIVFWGLVLERSAVILVLDSPSFSICSQSRWRTTPIGVSVLCACVSVTVYLLASQCMCWRHSASVGVTVHV